MYKPRSLPPIPFKVKTPNRKEHDALLNYLDSKGVTYSVPPSIHKYFIVHRVAGNLIITRYDTEVRHPWLFPRVVDTATDLTETFFPTEPELTVEEVFVLFLKQHRKFSAWKREHIVPVTATATAVPSLTILLFTEPQNFEKVWQPLHTKWKALCSQFNISDTTINLYKFYKL